MKTIVAILVAACLLLGSTGCVAVSFGPNGRGMVEGKGEIISVDYPVGEFTKLDVRNQMRVVYSAQATDKVTIELQENLVEYLIVKVENGVLTVDSEANIRVDGNRKVPTLYVSTPTLEEVRASGAIEFSGSDQVVADSFALHISGAGDGNLALNVKKLDVSVSGAGDLTLSGTADTANLSISGVGSIDALELQTKSASANVAGAGSISVSCSDSLTVAIGGTGSVEYRGSPQISQSIGGLGSVTQVK